jgi:hypothetical protein
MPSAPNPDQSLASQTFDAELESYPGLVCVRYSKHPVYHISTGSLALRISSFRTCTCVYQVVINMERSSEGEAKMRLAEAVPENFSKL